MRHWNFSKKNFIFFQVIFHVMLHRDICLCFFGANYFTIMKFSRVFSPSSVLHLMQTSIRLQLSTQRKLYVNTCNFFTPGFPSKTDILMDACIYVFRKVRFHFHDTNGVMFVLAHLSSQLCRHYEIAKYLVKWLWFITSVFA